MLLINSMYLLYQSSVFDDIAKLLARELNFQIVTKTINPSAFHLILDAADFDGQCPEIFDVIQFEQQNSKWMSDEYFNRLKKARHVYDFSYENLKYLGTQCINSILFKFGYSPLWTPFQEEARIVQGGFAQQGWKGGDMGNLDSSEVKAERRTRVALGGDMGNLGSPIVFIGKINERRNKIIQKLKEHFTVETYSNLYREDLELVISRAKIVLNIHYYDQAVLEVPRLLTMLLNKCLVLSEHSSDINLDQIYTNAVVYVPSLNIPGKDKESGKELPIQDEINVLIQKAREILDMNINDYTNLRHTMYTNFQTCKLELPTELMNMKVDTNTNINIDILPEKGIIEFAKAETEAQNTGIKLKLPLRPTLEEMPHVSIITITRNRPQLIQSAIRNWRHFRYPSSRMEWVVIDDSPDDSTKQVITGLKGQGGMNLITNEKNDTPIKYIHIPSIEPMSIADKRNLGCEYASYEIIAHMDDDDYYFPDSLTARVKTLIKYKGQYDCVGCTKYGIYDLFKNNSFLFNGPYLSEASMAYYKSFWQQQEFSMHPLGESIPFLKNRRSRVVIIPFDFNFIAITHNKNYTGKNRTAIENYSNKIFQAWDFETQQFYIKLYKQLKKAQEK